MPGKGFSYSPMPSPWGIATGENRSWYEFMDNSVSDDDELKVTPCSSYAFCRSNTSICVIVRSDRGMSGSNSSGCANSVRDVCNSRLLLEAR